MVNQKYLDSMTKEQAIAELRRLGLLIPFDKLRLYHGRASQEGEGEWKVDPNFNNAGNSTGNHNVNRVPALNVGSEEIATKFAIRRSEDNNLSVEQEIAKAKLRGEILKDGDNRYGLYHPRIHRIVTNNPEANIVDTKFNFSNLNADDKRVYFAAQKKLVIENPTTIALPKFKEKDDVLPIYNLLINMAKKNSTIIIDDNTLNKAKEAFFQTTGRRGSDELFDNLASTINTLNFLALDTCGVIDYYRANKPYEFDGKEYVLSQETIKRYMKANNILGAKGFVDSATIFQDNVETYWLFLSQADQFNTETTLLSEKAENYKFYWRLDRLLSPEKKQLFSKKASDILGTDNTYELMSNMRSLGKMEDCMKADAGVWEGYTVGEHTEAVLRLYNKYFANEMPENLQKVMRLSIFIHDLEKGIARQLINNNDPQYAIKKRQLRDAALTNLYSNLGVSSEIAGLAEFIAITSQKYTTDYFVNKNKEALNDLVDPILSTIENDLGLEKNFIIRPQVKALMQCCVIMQTCDSASYTSDWGVIRDEKTNVYYRGGNDKWNESFVKGESQPVLISPKVNTKKQVNPRPYGG